MATMVPSLILSAAAPAAAQRPTTASPADDHVELSKEVQAKDVATSDVRVVAPVANFCEEGLHVSCSICLCGDMKSPVVTCCGHVFCWPCVYVWCSENGSCPTCKGVLRGGQDFTPILATGAADLYDTVSSIASAAQETLIPARPPARRVAPPPNTDEDNQQTGPARVARRSRRRRRRYHPAASNSSLLPSATSRSSYELLQEPAAGQYIIISHHQPPPSAHRNYSLASALNELLVGISDHHLIRSGSSNIPTSSYFETTAPAAAGRDDYHLHTYAYLAGHAHQLGHLQDHITEVPPRGLRRDPFDNYIEHCRSYSHRLPTTLSSPGRRSHGHQLRHVNIHHPYENSLANDYFLTNYDLLPNSELADGLHLLGNCDLLPSRANDRLIRNYDRLMERANSMSRFLQGAGYINRGHPASTLPPAGSGPGLPSCFPSQRSTHAASDLTGYHILHMPPSRISLVERRTVWSPPHSASGPYRSYA